MDVITKIAEKFVKFYLKNNNQLESDEIVNLAKSQLYEIDSHLNKIKFLNIILEANNNEYELHKPLCKSPKNCS